MFASIATVIVRALRHPVVREVVVTVLVATARHLARRLGRRSAA
jgi:hypothetical protein